MPKFYIEGVFLTRRGVKKSQKSGHYSNSDLEPFARAFWAENAEDAIHQATEALQGGHWVEGPRLSKKSEEERMRAMGAPELPGFSLPTVKNTVPKKTRR